MERRGSAAFALVWNMICSRLPAHIVADFQEFIDKNHLRGMDGNGRVGQSKGDTVYDIEVESGVFSFHKAKLAPPMGLVAQNYSRYD